MKLLRKVLNFSESFIEYLSMGALIGMVLLIFTQVFTRYVLHFVLRWSEESAIILMIWLGFISVAIGVKRGTHLTISAIVNLFPKPVQQVINIMDELAVLIFGVAVTIYGRELSAFTMSSTMPATQLPSGVVYAILPVSGVMIICYTILRILDQIFSKNN